MYYFVDTWPTLLSHKITSSLLLFSLLFSLFQLSKNIKFNLLQSAYIILLYYRRWTCNNSFGVRLPDVSIL